jgi:hypothetical protein
MNDVPVSDVTHEQLHRVEQLRRCAAGSVDLGNQAIQNANPFARAQQLGRNVPANESCAAG